MNIDKVRKAGMEMARMDTKSSMEDICKRCGLSEEIVRRVQKAETEHIIYCLEHGMKANLPGRGTYVPNMRQKLVIGGEMEGYIKPRFLISSIITDAMQSVNEYKKLENDDAKEKLPEGIITMQIESLQ